VEPLIGAEEERSLVIVVGLGGSGHWSSSRRFEEMTLVNLLVVFTSFGVFNVIWGCTAVLF